MTRPQRAAALVGLALATCLAVMPAHADSSRGQQRPAGTGTIGNDAVPGSPTTRAQAIARAQHWVKEKVPYSQSRWWGDAATGGPYRQDCSGFVSMAWQLKDSLNTDSLFTVADRITWDQLQPGDALDTRDKGGHAILFAGWTDKSKGSFRYLAEPRPGLPALAGSANRGAGKIAGHPAAGYVPLKYRNITDGPAPTPIPAKPAVPAPPPVPTPSTTPPPLPTPAPPPGETPSAPPSAARPSAPSTAPAAPPTKPADTPPPAAPPGGAPSVAATGSHLYRITPDHTRVEEYTGSNGVWTKVGGPATGIYTTRTTLFATNPDSGDIQQYDRDHATWTVIGGPGSSFTTTTDHLYGVSPDHSGIYEYTGTPRQWVKASGPVAS
ncbi:hypothetical protein ACFWOG_20495 [Kitasatospora sp. NPDC058406]|uniref:hypothetical protein n=1 Tax=Kitasatospora sp. NPDC058406 TaxID=3346483 RepID=UPI003657C679